MVSVLRAAFVLTGLYFRGFLILLGDGWNFGFLAGSALVLECHRPEEKTRVQSLKEFVVFGLMAAGSFIAGGGLSAYGWSVVLWVSLVPLVLSGLALAAAMNRQALVAAERAGRL
ncbi:MAG: hypothetical protein ROZ37_04060 [Aromatoleum sp.]|jgi:predicted MFS family arabinose efflux permease|uniref:hypothetical protein n=1 Tax=Aromatoleum sp. TaxID=2307007 RepID=UPI002895DEE2|nr:hypothetical protein [Aromatoleum sp.]MDT3669493.1 hypothetical protein [Aromatoleum sp.]